MRSCGVLSGSGLQQFDRLRRDAHVAFADRLLGQLVAAKSAFGAEASQLLLEALGHVQKQSRAAYPRQP